MGRFGCMMGRFGQCNVPFWTIFLEIKIFGAVLVGAVLAMGRFGIDPDGVRSMGWCQLKKFPTSWVGRLGSGFRCTW